MTCDPTAPPAPHSLSRDWHCWYVPHPTLAVRSRGASLPPPATYEGTTQQSRGGDSLSAGFNRYRSGSRHGGEEDGDPDFWEAKLNASVDSRHGCFHLEQPSEEELRSVEAR